ncbi:MAG: hypothetical protein ACREXR_19085 [Gammaproteobacteria bacterium]
MHKRLSMGLVLLLSCLGFPSTQAIADTPSSAAKRSLRVLLYPFIPDPGNNDFKALKERLKAEFEKEHPDVVLTVEMDQNLDIYDCSELQKFYASTGPQVVEIDTVVLGYARMQGWASPLKYAEGQYAKAAVAASKIGPQSYAVPTLYGGNLFLVAWDKEILGATDVTNLLAILAKLDDGKKPKLVGNLLGSWVTPITRPTSTPRAPVRRGTSRCLLPRW